MHLVVVVGDFFNLIFGNNLMILKLLTQSQSNVMEGPTNDTLNPHIQSA